MQASSKNLNMTEKTYVLGERPNTNQKDAIFSGRGSVAHTWVEIPDRDGTPAAWLYTDGDCFRPGDTVKFFLSTNIAKIDIRIYRDGGERTLVYQAENVNGTFQAAPLDAYMNGCRWDDTFEWKSDPTLRSGAYLVEVSVAGDKCGAALGHHLLFFRAEGDKSHTLALVAATATWRAYNDFGGANHYRGLHPNYIQGSSPILSTQRPWARGQIWLPIDAPRLSSSHRPTHPQPPRYESFEYAKANGFARNYGSAGWATYERHFVEWAENNGYTVDILTQDELHRNPQVLDLYPCAVFVGHCEYWSAEMRHAVHRYLDAGGKAARFAGNFFWQIRMDYATGQQTCYKYNAREHDPLSGTDRQHLMTSAWEDPLVNWPGASTFGVNGLRGIYAGGLGAMAPRAARGFNVFRPDHWSFDGTGLGYAEMFGDEHNIFSYEVDGLNYTFSDGLPVPIGDDGCPDGLEILAMGWATLAETGLPEHRYAHAIGGTDAVLRAGILEGKTDPASVAKHSRGSGMIVAFKAGAGEVYTAGTCEWVVGLAGNDFYTSKVTKNVLDKFLGNG